MDVSCKFFFFLIFILQKVRLHTFSSRILRPGFFMENFDGTIGKITAAVLRSGLRPNTQLQLVVRSHYYIFLINSYIFICVSRQSMTLDI